jgi:C-terminal processing protease CtpA/Prc
MQQKPRFRSLLGRAGMPDDSGEVDNPWGVYTGPPPDPEVVEPVPDYMKTFNEVQTMQALDTDSGSIFPFGSFTPVFSPPAGFKLRLGAARTDQFLTGTFPVGSSSVGLIRVSTMSPSSTTAALQQFAAEIAFFQKNTDGLVIDVMGNGGGSLCYVESLMSYLIPTPFRSIAYYIRATQFWVEVYSSQLENAKLTGAPQWLIDVYAAFLKEVQQALAENRGMTGNVPICSQNFESVSPAKDGQGNVLAYTKPIVILTDNFSLSAAEAFSALMQDPGRATIFGTRTDGGGGNPASYNATNYSEGSTRATRTFVTRARPVQTPGFPASLFIENTGVYPDIIADYMTRDNLLNQGKAFVTALSSAISDLIAKAKP